MYEFDARQRLRTARRSGDTRGISLRKRRNWFADPPPAQPPAAGATSDATPNTDEEKPRPVPYDRFQEVNEAKKRAEGELQKLKDAEQARLLKEQEKAGEYTQVINSLKPKAERVDALEATLKTYLEAEIAEIPEGMRDLVPQGDVTTQLAWIKQAKTRGLFSKQPAPNTDFGRRGEGGNAPVKLTDLQKQMARAAGVSDEEYAKHIRSDRKAIDPKDLPRG